ncbi:YlqD family protein [Bacillus sp. SCS-153A]|uniref:YlqD family protein n=1 Tax=Rossellomorea sedimentorum TaxID=3115294 RepID=UPI0039063D27
MKILQNVTVNQVLTEASKEVLLEQYEGKKFQLQKECDQLKFELKKMEKTKKYSSQKLKSHFEKEIELRMEKIKLTDFQIDQLHVLPLGSELKDKEIQGIVEVEVGDNWEEKNSSRTIVIKDGYISEIR